MTIASACPEKEKLGKLIQGSLDDAESQRATDHLESCADCQEVLQSIASGEIPIGSLARGINQLNPPNDSAYWRAVTALGQEVHSSSDTPALSDTASELPRVVERELEFLSASTDPAYMGELDHFQISRVIGRGGMGIVLEAFDPHLHRTVAIKVLNPRFQENDVARQRFCREGRAAAAISHEHVVAMHHVARGNEGKPAYLVMQLIDGETLEQRLADGKPLPAQEVARIGMQIAAGLSAAHSRDMVHRDIKPANILIESETERVKLTDFGLARASDDIRLTQTGMVSGTPLYMSPEQAMGKTADERSDLFALGAVMYEMATGSSPFQAPTAVGVMKRIMDEMPPPPQRVNPNITKSLSDIIQSLLAKNPDDRPESAASLAAALAGVVTQFGPISPLQVPAVAKSAARRISGEHRVIHRRWIFAGWAAAALAVLGILTSVSLWISPPDAAEADADSFPSVVLADNPGTVWSVDFVPGRDEIAAGIADGSLQLWDIPSRKVIKSFTAHRGAVWMVKFHPSQSIAATCGDDGRVKLWDAETFELLKEWKAGNTVRSIAFSPNGERIIAGDRDGTIHVYDIESGDELVSKSQPGSILGIDYSFDGKLIGTVGSDKTVRLFDAESLADRQTMPGHDGPIYNVAFAPTGPLLATVGWKRNIRIWNADTGSQMQNLEGSEGDVWGVAFCPDGSHLVTAGQDGAARIFELSDGSLAATLRGHQSAVHNVTLDPDHFRIATSSRDGSIRVWDLSSLQEKHK